MIPLPIPRGMVKTVAAVLALLLMLGALITLRGCSGPGPRPPAVITTADQVNAGRPTAEKPSIPQRIATVAVAPTGSAVAPRAAAHDVAAFCRAAGYRLPATADHPAAAFPAAIAETPTAAGPPGDTAAAYLPPPSAPPVAGPSFLYVSAGTVDPHRLVLWTDRSDGSAGVDTFAIRRRASFTRDRGELVVRTPRFGKLRDALPVLECGAGAAASWQLDKQSIGYAWVPAALACAHGAWKTIR